jgi:hypothetical protein
MLAAVLGFQLAQMPELFAQPLIEKGLLVDVLPQCQPAGARVKPASAEQMDLSRPHAARSP